MRLLKPFKQYQYLLTQLTIKEVKARYKQSIIGYAWVLVNPLAQLLVYTFVFAIVFRFPTGDIPYTIFLFAGLLPWTLFATGITAATQSLVVNSSLLRKVAFPREIIPYSVVFSKVVDFCFSSLVFLAFILFYQVQISHSVWMVLPLFLIQLILMLGISLILAAANLFYRDIQYLAGLIIMLWMYMTPVVYPVSMVPERYLWIYKLNPMVGIVEGYRSALFGYQFEWSIIGWSFGLTILLFIVAYHFFKKSEKVFADVA